VPGSCPPNWLHGKARISKPEVTSDWQHLAHQSCVTWRSQSIWATEHVQKTHYVIKE
jgi:hypothetical protein